MFQLKNWESMLSNMLLVNNPNVKNKTSKMTLKNIVFLFLSFNLSHASIYFYFNLFYLSKDAQSSDELWILIIWFGLILNPSEQTVTQPSICVLHLRSNVFIRDAKGNLLYLSQAFFVRLLSRYPCN